MSTSREVPFLGKSRKISEMHGAEAAGGADGTSATGIEVRGTMFECDGACGFSGHYSEVDASCSDLFKALLSECGHSCTDEMMPWSTDCVWRDGR